MFIQDMVTDCRQCTGAQGTNTSLNPTTFVDAVVDERQTQP